MPTLANDPELEMLGRILLSTYFVQDARVLIFNNPKCGSTALPFFYALLEGKDPVALCDSAPVAEVGWAQGIHAQKGQLTGIWSNLSADAQLAAWNDPAVARYMFVRDPIERCWAAWVSKILVREPAFLPLCGEAANLTTAEWEERVLTWEGLVHEFETFASLLLDGRPAARDQHFMPQSNLTKLLPGDTQFIPLTSMWAVTRAIALASGVEVSLPRVNETIVHFAPGSISTHIRNGLAEFYSDDAELFGDALAPREEVSVKAELTSEQVRTIRDAIRASQRLSTWVASTRTSRKRLRIVHAELDALRRKQP